MKPARTPGPPDPDAGGWAASAERSVCLVLRGRRLAFSGYNAQGSPSAPPAFMRVDVGADHRLTESGALEVEGLGPAALFTAAAVALAARLGWFGFRVVEGPHNRQMTRPVPRRGGRP